MRRWRELYEKVTGFVRVAWQAGLTIYLAWWLWQDSLIETAKALWSVNVPLATQAVAVSCGVVLALYLLERRFNWLGKNLYWFVARFFIKQTHRDNWNEVRSTMDGLNVMGAFFIHSDSDHWLVRKIEAWITRILVLVAWPTLCVALSDDLFGETSLLSAMVWLLVTLLLLAFLAAKFRTLMTGLLFGVWLEYVSATQGRQELKSHAAVLGICLTLWGLWGRWRDKIAQPPPPAPAVE